MIAYVDTSVFLRVAFNEPTRLADWGKVTRGVTSELARVECRRAIDRLRVLIPLPDTEVTRRLEVIQRFLELVDVIELSPPILERASDPYPTALGTLDAIHLSSALLWQRSEGTLFDAFLTHDVELGRAARAMSLNVLGCR